MANDTDMQAVILRLLLGLWDNDSLAVVLVYKKKKKGSCSYINGLLVGCCCCGLMVKLWGGDFFPVICAGGGINY